LQAAKPRAPDTPRPSQPWETTKGRGNITLTSSTFNLIAPEGKAYFLSRPRRFGKSLFLDTLAELFAGNEPLFRGLYCHDQWDWSVKYPVIRLSFGAGISSGQGEALAQRIREILQENAQRLGLTLEDASWREISGDPAKTV
jgi:hypothetical protein